MPEPIIMGEVSETLPILKVRYLLLSLETKMFSHNLACLSILNFIIQFLNVPLAQVHLHVGAEAGDRRNGPGDDRHVRGRETQGDHSRLAGLRRRRTRPVRRLKYYSYTWTGTTFLFFFQRRYQVGSDALLHRSAGRSVPTGSGRQLDGGGRPKD